MSEAKVHFGELIQQAQKEPIAIERNGKSVVVVQLNEGMVI